MRMTKASGLKTLKFFSGASFLLMVAVNALANTLPINSLTTGQVSAAYPNLFAPAGVTFSIWGLIYAWLAVFIVYQSMHFSNHTRPGGFAAINRWFILSCIANAAWIFSWHYRAIPLSMLWMAVLLVSLIQVNRTLTPMRLTDNEKLFIKVPFSIYLGWITVAAIANATVLAVSLGWIGQGPSQEPWTLISIGAALGIGLAVTLIRQDIAYGAVLVWAFGGILIKHLSAGGFAGQYPDIILAASIAVAAMLISLWRVALRGPRSKRSGFQQSVR